MCLLRSLDFRMSYVGRPNMLWHSPLDKELCQPIEHVIGSQPSFDIDGQTFPRVCVHNGEKFDRSPIFGPGRHEVVRPHMIRMLRSQPDTGAIGRPEPPTRRLFLRDLQAFAPPDPFHPLVTDPPTVSPEQACDLTIPIPIVLACEPDNRLGQCRFVMGRLSLIPLGGAGLAEHPTGPSFGDTQRGTAVLHGLPSARGLSSFPRRPLSGSIYRG